jgi:D-proline reductase (dithiol) PrdB
MNPTFFLSSFFLQWKKKVGRKFQTKIISGYVMSLKTWKDGTLAKFFTRHPALIERWARSNKFVINRDTPWAPLTKEIGECQIALVTTGGAHLRCQPPFNMQDKDGDPTWREIPSQVGSEDLTITHNYYDHRDADQDINVVFPIQRLRELEAKRIIGGIAPRHFSFMGHIIGRHLDTLIKRTGPDVARMLKEDGAEAVFLTPA